MDTFEGLALDADKDTVARLGRVWRMLPVGTGRRLSHGRVVSSATTVRLRHPPQPSTNSYVDLVAVFAILKKIGGVPTGILPGPG